MPESANLPTIERSYGPHQHLDDEQLQLVLSLEDNFNPSQLIDADIYLPLFVYGTLLPGEVGGKHEEALTILSMPAELHSARLYARRRYTRVFGMEHFPMAIAGEPQDVSVKGTLLFLNPKGVCREKNAVRRYEQVIFEHDRYEEVENNLFVRTVVKVGDHEGHSYYAIAYLATLELVEKQSNVPLTVWQKENIAPFCETTHAQLSLKEQLIGNRAILYAREGDVTIHDGDFANYLQQVKRDRSLP